MSVSDAVSAIHSRISELQQPPPAAQIFLDRLTVVGTAMTVTPAATSPTASNTTASNTTATGITNFAGGLPSADAKNTVLAMRATTPFASISGATGGGDWTANLPAAGAPYVGMITDAATRAGVEPSLLAGLVWVESGFRPEVVSSAGAIGLGQLMPATAASLGVDPTDPAANLNGAARMMRGLIDQFGDVHLALAAYNGGPNAITRNGGVPSPNTAHYADTVLAYQARLLASNGSIG
jgi:soluble lytic murein transglycosylase-like protein